MHEEEEILVINKAAGLVCHPTKGDAFSSLISRVRLYLGDVVPAHLINRLDRETSGLVLVAKSEKAVRELRREWENRRVLKEYRAIVHGSLARAQGLIDAPLGRDVHSEVTIKDCVRADGARAQTRYECLHVFRRTEGVFSLVRVWPQTGRKHQIRIHLAHLGYPIVGDKLYGGDDTLYLNFVYDRMTREQAESLLLRYHALHAQRLEFSWRGEARHFEVSPEPFFEDFIRAGERVECPEMGHPSGG